MLADVVAIIGQCHVMIMWPLAHSSFLGTQDIVFGEVDR